MKKIVIESEYITLGQFLKFANIIGNGGEAKVYLASHRIWVNGEEENRRGRKLFSSDEVKIANEVYCIQKK